MVMSFTGSDRDRRDLQVGFSTSDLGALSKTPTLTLDMHHLERPRLHHGDSLEVPTPRDDVTKAVWLLYTSRFLAAWGQRFWSFGSALFMFALRPEDLVLVSVLGLSLNIGKLLLTPVIGTWIDSVGRLTAARTLLIVQNLSIACACALFACYFEFPNVLERHFVLVVVATTFLSVVAALASSGIKILMERDWIVVIAGHDDALLAKTNSVFQSIDLLCKTLAPVLAGVLLSNAGYFPTAIVMASWNLVSAAIELTFLTWIYTQFRGLRWKPKPDNGKKKRGRCGGSCRAWRTFFTHEIRNAGMALSALYMTVLGFDSVTWAYTLLQGIEEQYISMFVGVGALIGMTGTLLYPRIRRKCGVEKTGIIGMSILVACQSLCVISMWLPGSPFELARTRAGSYTSIGVLIGGITSARLGLWLADISITQITQEKVEAEHRGKIGGVQGALNSLMSLIKFALCVIFPKPETFGYLIIASYASIVTGALLFTSYGVKAMRSQTPRRGIQGGPRQRKQDESSWNHIPRPRKQDESTPLLN